MVPERIRFVSMVMAQKDRSKIHQMTSQAAQFVKVTKVAEFILTSLYVYLCSPEIAINETSFAEIVHVMGTIRVNAFSITQNGDAIATGLYSPSNLINHQCGTNANVSPLTEAKFQQMVATRDIKAGE